MNGTMNPCTGILFKPAQRGFKFARMLILSIRGFDFFDSFENVLAIIFAYFFFVAHRFILYEQYGESPYFRTAYPKDLDSLEKTLLVISMSSMIAFTRSLLFRTLRYWDIVPILTFLAAIVGLTYVITIFFQTRKLIHPEKFALGISSAALLVMFSTSAWSFHLGYIVPFENVPTIISAVGGVFIILSLIDDILVGTFIVDMPVPLRIFTAFKSIINLVAFPFIVFFVIIAIANF